jgi:hypothetical protein
MADFNDQFSNKIHRLRSISQVTLFFSLLAGNLRAETGSTATASATTHSDFQRDFPAVWQLVPNWPSCDVSFVSAAALCELLWMFRRLCLCAQNSVSRKQILRFEETRFECRYPLVRLSRRGTAAQHGFANHHSPALALPSGRARKPAE